MKRTRVEQILSRSFKTCVTPLRLCDNPCNVITSFLNQVMATVSDVVPLNLFRKMHFSEECLARRWTVTEPPNAVQRLVGGSGSSVRGGLYRKFAGFSTGSTWRAFTSLNAFSTVTVDDKLTS